MENGMKDPLTTEWENEPISDTPRRFGPMPEGTAFVDMFANVDTSINFGDSEVFAAVGHGPYTPANVSVAWAADEGVYVSVVAHDDDTAERPQITILPYDGEEMDIRAEMAAIAAEAASR